MRRTALTTLALGAVLRATAQITDPAQSAAIIAQLEDAPTSAARFNLLNGRDFVFDFNAGVGVGKGAGGNITVANLSDFPFLLGQGMSLTVGKMAPCGLSSPHYHPRATEFLYMISGSNLKVGFIRENGARLVTNILNPGQGTIFPKGSFHYQVNLGCEPVSFVAGLNSADPGAATIAQRFFGIPPDVVDATLGDIGVNEVVQIAKSIPDTFALGVQSCLDKCKIRRGDQSKYQQQPSPGYDSPDSPGSPDDGDDDEVPPYNQGGNFGNNDHEPSPDDESEDDWDNDEWDGGEDDDDQGVDDPQWGDDDYSKDGGVSSPNNDNWWDEGDDSGVRKYPHEHGGGPDSDTGVKKSPKQKSDKEDNKSPDQMNNNKYPDKMNNSNKNPDQKNGNDRVGPDGKNGNDRNSDMKSPDRKNGNDRMGPDGKNDNDRNSNQKNGNDRVGPDGKNGNDRNSDVKSPNRKNGDDRIGPDGKNGNDRNSDVKSPDKYPDRKSGNDRVGPDGKYDDGRTPPQKSGNDRVGPDGKNGDGKYPDRKSGNDRVGPDGKYSDGRSPPQKSGNDRVGPDGKNGNDRNSDVKSPNKYPDQKNGNDRVGPDGKYSDGRSPPQKSGNDRVGPDGKNRNSRYGPSGKNGNVDYPHPNDGISNVKSGAVRGKSITSPFSSSRYSFKRSNGAEDRVTLTSAISSTDARTLEELVFFLKLVLCVLLSGYMFILAYFVVPAWRNNRLQAELQVHPAVPSPIPVQDLKA